MIDFVPVTPENVLDMEPLLRTQGFRTCDFTVGVMYQWHPYFNTRFAIEDGMLFVEEEYPDKGRLYLYPTGTGDTGTALDRMAEDSAERGNPFCLTVFSERDLEFVREHFRFRVVKSELQESWRDYVYDVESLKTFSGKKMHRQKNHLNRFEKDHPGYRYVEIVPETQEKAERFLEYFSSHAKLESRIERTEMENAKKMLHAIFDLHLIGGFIETEAGVTGLSIGEIVGDTLYVHVEKALAEIAGSYQAIVAQFARHASNENTKYCNREDDADDPGIRQSKQAYHPVFMTDKYWVQII